MRRLPDIDVAADRRDAGVPGVHGDREIECRDRADDTEWMPLLVHAMLRAFRVHRAAVQHAGLADGQVGDIDHLLDLAVSLCLDLAVLESDQAAERVLVFTQRIRNLANGLAANRSRHRAPGNE